MPHHRKLLLSVDFDFFVRELPTWDWGHSENGLFFETVWPIRYAEPRLDLEQETNPDTFADFPPEALSGQLSRLVSSTMAFHRVPAATAESHRGIMDFIKMLPPVAPDIVINLDAHHDAFTDLGAPIACDNWVTHLYADWPQTEQHWVVPRWQKQATGWYGTPLVPITLHHGWQRLLADLKGEKLELMGLFICRSGCWVPPHLDERFNRMVGRFGGKQLHLTPRELDRTHIAAQKELMRSLYARMTPQRRPEDRV